MSSTVGNAHQLFGLIERIYATVQNPALWTPVVAEISQIVGGDSIAIYAGFPDSKTPELLAVNAIGAPAWKAFAEHYALINPLMQRCEQKFLPGTTWSSEQGMSDAELERTEFYTDFYEPNDMHYTLGLRIPLWGSAAGSLSCQRSKAAGPFDPQTDIVIQTLKPHLQRALTLHHQMSQMQTRILGLGAAFDAFDQAIFCIDAAGCVVFSNHLAETLLRTGSGLRLVQNRLRAALPDVDCSLQQLLSSALNLDLIQSPQNDASLRFISIERANHAEPLRLSAAPFRPGSEAPANNIAALVFVYDPERRPASRSHALRTLYGLTPAEIRVAEHLLAGLEIRELAAKMVMTLETARFHVKRILAKTGARRQSELMRLMLSLPGV